MQPTYRFHAVGAPVRFGPGVAIGTADITSGGVTWRHHFNVRPLTGEEEREWCRGTLRRCMRWWWPALLALLLAGCAHLPATMRPATPEELSAVDALTEAWAASGREVPACPVLDRVDVYTGPQADVASWCAREGSCTLSACTFAPNRYVWATPSTTLYIREDVSPERHLRLVLHELAHRLRGCWREHIDHGESEACQITQPVDGRHCDSELWGPILRDAADRLEAPR